MSTIKPTFTHVPAAALPVKETVTAKTVTTVAQTKVETFTGDKLGAPVTAETKPTAQPDAARPADQQTPHAAAAQIATLATQVGPRGETKPAPFLFARLDFNAVRLGPSSEDRALATQFGVSPNAMKQLRENYLTFGNGETFERFLTDSSNGPQLAPGTTNPKLAGENNERLSAFFDRAFSSAVPWDDPRRNQALSFFAEKYDISPQIAGAFVYSCFREGRTPSFDRLLGGPPPDGAGLAAWGNTDQTERAREWVNAHAIDRSGGFA